MKRIHGFPPVSAPDARVLILGSMPSQESLARQQYYAHPRNAFWPIVTSLLEISSTEYDERVRQAAGKGLAIWDVLRDCVRSGSLDSDIDENTAVTNDFGMFFSAHPHIGRVFFNGAKAESIYLKRVLPDLPEQAAALPMVRLPSTSAANAGMSFEQKKSAWKAIVTGGLE
jgi:TDG/mug DNA glycosylase family protein